MRSIAVIVTCFLILVLGVAARCGETSTLIIPTGDTRAGAVFFVDECLTRGVTNSISIDDLRTWATNLVRHYQQLQPIAAGTNAVEKPYPRLLLADLPKAIQLIQNHTPSCRSVQPLNAGAFG